MSATGQLLKCRCGMGMMPTQGDSEGYYCPNCDQCQPQERLLERAKTVQDVVYDMYWDRVIRDEYKDNTKAVPEVGSANFDGEGDTPPKNEGETT